MSARETETSQQSEIHRVEVERSDLSNSNLSTHNSRFVYNT